MLERRPLSPWQRLKVLVIGSARDPFDRSVFHKLSLVVFFAWVGLGVDPVTSSCYGPEEAYLNLGGHYQLGIFVGLMTAITVLIIIPSYHQIVELFPGGGGGYVVASKLLSPKWGMISGAALLVDYVLTASVSVVAGADAVFSFLPPAWYPYRGLLAVAGILILLMLNLRGVRESVLPLIPIFIVFMAAHVCVIVYALAAHLPEISKIAADTALEVHTVRSTLGTAALIFIVLRAFTMGAGTFTGLEAVSNAVPLLREPKVETAKTTMRYMGFTLAFLALGLMVAYIIFGLQRVPGRTLNAVLFSTVTGAWDAGLWGSAFVWIALISEALMLFAAAQTGFLDGPRVLSNMALDHWVPTRFASLSDRLVAKNGYFLMAGAAIATIILTGASIKVLVILYSINVFITFVLSKLGMVIHWWLVRAKERLWKRKLFINGLGLVICLFILVAVSVIKFHEGGWATLIVTSSVAFGCYLVHRHYAATAKMVKRLDNLVLAAVSAGAEFLPEAPPEERRRPACDPHARTAVLLVNGFNGLGLHTLFSVMRVFGGIYRNFVFVQVGVIDAGTFKGAEEVKRLEEHVSEEVDRYVDYVQGEGYFARGYSAVGTDVVDEVEKLAPVILREFPQAVFFGGQLVFPQDSAVLRFLHNNIVFSVQWRFYQLSIPFVILPVRV